MKKTTVQCFCDICGKLADGTCTVEYPVIFHTEQTEGRACKPYISTQDIDLCNECIPKVLKIHAVGAQGHNTYSLEEDNP